ncbi:MAG: hypothetical protein M1833_003755 [Piccolia ochrophora]|nr:MAG: hypothetical protein M1833_003755 [Piccolia ochrophora]
MDVPNIPSSSTYPAPFIVPSIKEHRQTLIILHGRGDNASSFAPSFLCCQTPLTETLSTALPHSKFIFPTASKRRAALYKRYPINQWFDNWILHEPTEREDLQIDGLRETSAYIHGLLRAEIAHVGARNVVLAGLSQGCAAALVALLTWHGDPLAAVVGMCGWLPFRKRMEDIARDTPAHDEVEMKDEDDPFEREDDSGQDAAAPPEIDPPTRAVTFLHEELETNPPSPSMAFQPTPVFLGHGVEDGKVPVELGREAVSCLRSLGVEVQWSEYEGLGHWYSGDMLGDVVGFVHGVVG